jgi:hypothetical protein
MLYREIIAVCSQIHTKHRNTLCGQNVELLNVKLAVRVVPTKQADRICSSHTGTVLSEPRCRYPSHPIPSQLPCVLLAKPRDAISVRSVAPYKNPPHSWRHNRKKQRRRSTASDEWTK